MPEIVQDETFSPGDTDPATRRLGQRQRVISDQDIERRDMPAFVRVQLPQLRQWAGDAQDVAALTAMTAGQRLARQAVIEARVAVMAKAIMGIAWQLGQDDGS